MKFSFVLLLSLTAACGSVDNGDLFEDADGGELGSVEQAYNAPVTLNTQFGTQTGTSRNRCDRASSGQACSVPSYQNVLICIDNSNPFQQSTLSRINVLLPAIDQLLTTRTVGGVPLDIFGQPDCTQANTWITRSPVGTSGTASNDIANYSRPDFSGITQLTENGQAGEPAVVGQYQRHQGCTIRLDEVDILAKGANAAQDQSYLDHAFVNAFMACIGKGRIPSGVSNFNRAMQHDMSSTHNNDAMTSGELCQLNSYNPANNGNFANAGNCGND